MEPYNSYMHTYGPVAPGVGVDKGNHQFFGKKASIGRLTLPEMGTLLVSTPILIAAGAAGIAVAGLTRSELGAYMNGFQRNLNRKQIATRNAVLGAAFGSLAAASMGYVFIRT